MTTTPTQPTTDLAPTAAGVARLVTGVRDDQLADPTPCAGTPVAGLLDHLAGLTLAFRLAAQKRPVGGAPRADAAALDPAWRTGLPAGLDALAAAWRDPSAWDGMTAAGGVDLPGAVAGLVALTEVLVHGWDLAAALGQPYEPDPAAVQAALGLVTGPLAAARSSVYGPEVAVPDDGPPMHRLLGLTGRDPGWRPPA